LISRVHDGPLEVRPFPPNDGGGLAGYSCCRAIGYKSFPNLYLQQAKPLQASFDVYRRKVLLNPDVKKIILKRRDVVRTYLSSRRAFETGIYMARRYQHHKVTVDLVDM